MANLGDGFKNIFLAGIGAMAITGEKTKELVDQLVAKGELTVDQGKEINSELRHKAESAVGTARDGALEAYMAAMTPEQRAEFAAKAAEFAAKADAEAAGKAQVGDASPVVAVEEPAPAAEEAPKAEPQAPSA